MMNLIAPLAQSMRKKWMVFFSCCLFLPAIAQTTALPSNELTPEEKMFGLSKFWSEVKYNFVYFNQIGEEKWDSIYRDFMKIVPQTKDNEEYYKELKRMCALLKDGHTNIYYNHAKIITTYFDSLQWYIACVEGRPIVEKINELNKEKIPVGTEIVKVNGLPAKEYIEKYSLPYVSSSTDYVRWRNATLSMFSSTQGVSYDVELLTPDRRTLKMHITHEVKEPVRSDPLYPAEKESGLMELKWYSGDIAYVALNAFHDKKINEQFDNVFPELKKRAKKLIIDIRRNGGGSTSIGADILSYLTPDSVLIGSRWETRVYAASHAAWGKFLSPSDTIGDEWAKKSYMTARGEYYEGEDASLYSISPEHERLVVPTAILIGNYTASAAEDFLILADKQKHIVKIGQPSNGSTGQPIMLDLVRGFSARICTKKDTYPDGRMFVGCGVKPDIEVVPTIQDFIDERDRTLETALEYLKKK